MPPADALATGDWSAGVEVRPAPMVAEEILARRPAVEGRRSVWVTDLVDLRPAFWRATAPVAPSPERRALMDLGRETHVQIGHAMAPARFREVRLHREGITGQIDWFEETPTELKTTRLPSDVGVEPTVRPAYLEQLAMYCALADRPVGRLVLVDPGEEPRRVAVLSVQLRDRAAAWEEMRARARQLRAALEARSPEGLPACPWRERGCEFREAEVCDCTGQEPPATSDLLRTTAPPETRPELAREIAERLTVEGSHPPAARRFRDLLYPRRAYFERTAPPESSPTGGPPPALPRGEDLYRLLSDLLDAGPTGEVTREPALDGEPLESVLCFRGDPLLLKVSRAWSATPVDGLLTSQPQYLMELGLRCAAVGRSSGWLWLGYSRSPDWSTRAYLYRVLFRRADALVALLEHRRRALASAVASGQPYDLPACPGWMYDGCPYRARCDCGAFPEGGRSNR